MIVVDASALLDVLLDAGAGEKVARRIFSEQELHSPHLLDAEVMQAVRRHVLTKQVSELRAYAAIEFFAEIPIVRHSHQEMLWRVWQLRQSVSAYDAMYVALAEFLDAPLVTRDSKLKRAHGHRAKIEVI